MEKRIPLTSPIWSRVWSSGLIIVLTSIVTSALLNHLLLKDEINNLLDEIMPKSFTSLLALQAILYLLLHLLHSRQQSDRAVTTLRSDAGFTLVEMLVVLALFAILAAESGFIIMGGRSTNLVALTTEQLTADLQLTRIDAVRSGRIHSLFFELSSRRWRREGAPPMTLGHGLVLDLVTAREAAGWRSDVGDVAAIAFLPDGRSTGGRIEISMKGEHRSLVVNWLTGSVREARP